MPNPSTPPSHIPEDISAVGVHHCRAALCAPCHHWQGNEASFAVFIHPAFTSATRAGLTHPFKQKRKANAFTSATSAGPRNSLVLSTCQGLPCLHTTQVTSTQPHKAIYVALCSPSLCHQRVSKAYSVLASSFLTSFSLQNHMSESV